MYKTYIKLIPTTRSMCKPPPSKHNIYIYIYIYNIHIVLEINYFKSSKLTKIYRSTKIDMTSTPHEFSIRHKSYINHTVRSNLLPSNLSDENSFTTPTSQKKTTQLKQN